MEYKPNELIIRQGLDEEDLLLFWPMTEWITGFTVLGLFIVFRHILLGIGLLFLILYLFLKFRNEERGSKFHFLWRMNLWRSKKGFFWAPPAHATRFDN